MDFGLCFPLLVVDCCQTEGHLVVRITARLFVLPLGCLTLVRRAEVAASVRRHPWTGRRALTKLPW